MEEGVHFPTFLEQNFTSSMNLFSTAGIAFLLFHLPPHMWANFEQNTSYFRSEVHTVGTFSGITPTL